MCESDPVSYEVPGSGAPGWGPIRRAVLRDDLFHGLPTHDNSGRFGLTSYENFIHATETFPSMNCLGHRPINSNSEAGPYQWLTYSQVREQVEYFSAGLVKLGLCPRSTGDKELREQGVLGIMMRNRPEWFIAEQACFFQSVIPVPFYDTAKSDTVGSILRNITSLHAIVCSSLTIKELIRVKEQLGSSIGLSTLICCDDGVSLSSTAGLKVISFDFVISTGRSEILKRFPKPVCSNSAYLLSTHSPPSPDDIYTFCFTSGTTGEPKGALISHKNLVSNSCAIGNRLRSFSVGNEVCLSFLPLPHMFERVAQVLAISAGGAIGFYQGDALKLVDDLVELRPTRFVAVPRVLSRIRDKVAQSIRETGGVTERLFNYGIAREMRLVGSRDVTSRLLHKILFSKIRAKLGLDRVKQILTGSAPIAPETLFWFRAVFGSSVPVNEGYGQTECTLVCSVQGVNESSAGDCGGPLACCDVRLMDVPEMGYRSTDRVHGKVDEQIACIGRGEICIRGDNVFKGYYKMGEKTAEAIDSNGWLHTGDIGLWTSIGQLKIIDRKKNIFKLSQGEYVAPEKIESIFSTSKFVMQSFVYGDSFRNCLVSIVVPNPDTVTEWWKLNGRKGTSDGAANAAALPPMADLCGRKDLNLFILEELTAKGKQAKLNGFELVKAIHLEPEPWTPENLLTPTFKLKRKEAEVKYKKIINELYAQAECIASKL